MGISEKSAGRSAQFEQEYFDTVYQDYAAQNPPRKLRFYRRLAESAVRDVGEPRLLDVGCAFGALLAVMPSTWKRFGTDVSHHAIEIASKRVDGVTFATYDGLNLPFPGPFDLVTALDVLEHVPHLNELLDRIARILAPGGALLAVVPVYDGPTGPIIRALDRDETHVHKRARGFWLSKLGEQFRLESWQGMYRYLLPTGYYVHLPTKIFRRFTPSIAVLVRKSPL